MTDAPPVHNRLTVTLTERAVQALELAARDTGDTKTDTVNRALQLYAYITHLCSDDGSVYVRVTGDAELEKLYVL